jgi:hypothetical protein
MSKVQCFDARHAEYVYRYQKIKELRIVLIKWWLIMFEWVCRCSFDVLILVHECEQVKRIGASEIILHLWECVLLHLLFL